MEYDPIKRTLGRVFGQTVFSRILFYHMLDLLLLRTWHIHRELRKWKSGINGPAHILDAGAGFGQYAYFISRLSDKFSILGLDVKVEQVCECNHFFRKLGRHNVLFRVEDLTTYTAPQSFDLALCVDVMEHIEDDVQVMRNICTSLKPGGVLIISTPSDQGGSDVHSHGQQSFIEEHVRDGYNKQEIKEKLKSAGFSKVKVHYSYGVPGKISWKLSMKYPMKMLNASRIFFVLLPFYYLIFMPPSLILNFIDSHTAHNSGTGLIVKATR